MRSRGVVSIQGSSVSPGATVIPRDVIRTGPNSAANFSLQHYSMTVLPGTQVSMLADIIADGIKLQHGSVVLQEQSISPMRIEIPGAWVVVRGERSTGALCKISSLGTSSKVSLQLGFAEIHAAGAPVVLHAGEWAGLEVGGKPYEGPSQSGQPQASQPGMGREAGKVTREIPRGTLDRRGQTLPLNLNDPVEWNDQIHTFQLGRLQITLSDGSLLSVGSHSEMKIVRHDAQAQQTDLELAVAKVRADVQKITKSGGKFEFHTKTAVIGVVGTSFIVAADERSTRVCVIDGEVEVRNSHPAVPQTSVRVSKGDCVSIRSGTPPGTPATSPAEILRLVSQTTVGEMASSAGAAASGAATGGASSAVIATVVAVGALAGILGGLAAAGEFSSSRAPISP